MENFIKLGRKIVAVARNYRKHAAELNNPVPEEPMIFLKPTSSYIQEGEAIRIPPGCNRLFHEVELGIVIGKRGSNIPYNHYLDYVYGYILALDMTARDLTEVGLPWNISKGFDTACPVSKLITKSALGDPHSARLWLKVDGIMKQDGNTSDMVHNIPKLISYISQFMTLEPGDVILTGTPDGIGPVIANQNITCGINDVLQMSFNVE
ncbi:uncharacterized protein TRIADDRAFT_51068 [Trichoplax adhaerens]|uniref:Oxaloacetate tautomerase FAHD1, mitochondrial n=1 Tax=Trichoplax adhaerens TaxID=10228 RepID=B3SB72_TRIAD|nr:hypothetical protein TRIADDRAFT_51068 [Trichoplax adhaerens]EDV20113.1 hypothetical protein TRIADDRAFT_51068 [Trichoplax adhaerens]|eukprot:XP_002117497.1 hypothetical protein TRIADDRAFT_51068 [Trichoplax adhaerens]